MLLEPERRTRARPGSERNVFSFGVLEKRVGVPDLGRSHGQRFPTLAAIFTRQQAGPGR